MNRIERLEERRRRVEIANRFLRIISSHGRRFFYFEGRVSHFELDKRDRVWFIDKYRGSRLWTHQHRWGYRFTEGGTLLTLCRVLRDYIMARGPLPTSIYYLGPWPSWVNDDPWGYGAAMDVVRAECLSLARTQLLASTGEEP